MSIFADMQGNRKKCIKKEQKRRFWALSGGGLMELVYVILCVEAKRGMTGPAMQLLSMVITNVKYNPLGETGFAEFDAL